MTPEPDPYQDSGATGRILSSLRSIQAPADFEQGVACRVLLNSLPTLSAPPSFEADVLRRIQYGAASEPSQSPEQSLPREHSITDSSFSAAKGASSVLWKYGLTAVFSAISIAALWYWTSGENVPDAARQQTTIQQGSRSSTPNANNLELQKTALSSEQEKQSPSTNEATRSSSSIQTDAGSKILGKTLKSSAKTQALQRSGKDSVAQIDAVRGAVIPKHRLDEE